jgi:hypothetical protein
MGGSNKAVKESYALLINKMLSLSLLPLSPLSLPSSVAYHRLSLLSPAWPLTASLICWSSSLLFLSSLCWRHCCHSSSVKGERRGGLLPDGLVDVRGSFMQEILEKLIIILVL